MADDGLHDRDFYAWALEQAQALRAPGSNVLDRENLAEEVEDLGRFEFNAVESHVANILEHLLKIEFVGPVENVDHWSLEITAFRQNVRRKLTPTIQRKMQDALDDAYADALELTTKRLRLEGREVTISAARPYAWDDVMGRGTDWTPEPRYGAEEA